MFWGNEILKVRLQHLISDYSKARLDRGNYRLRIGPEVYISPTGEVGDQKNKPKLRPYDYEGFTIPSGQFGFLLTEEEVKVPNDAIAFISIRAGYKFRGLVNVSGFHVDPGYEGRLVFSVFNAGPGPVHLSRGEECFHIWYASLDQPSRLGAKIGYQEIPSKLINPIAGEIQSFAGLDAKIANTDDRLTLRLNKLERDHKVIQWGVGLIVAVAITLGLRECSLSNQPSSPTSSSANTEIQS